MTLCRKSLEENLFVLHRCLSPALLRLKHEAENICENELMAAIDPNTTYTLEEFRSCQLGKMGIVSVDMWLPCILHVGRPTFKPIHILV